MSEALAKLDGLLQSWQAAVQDTQDQMHNNAQASLQSSNSLATLTHDLNGRHTLKIDALRKTHDARAAELSKQVTRLQSELEEERRARK
ncbi:TPA: hypothetical protein ACH3X3_010536 [Trebouxia sp. C0006]